MIYRLSAEVLIEAVSPERAADKLRDAVCEVDGEVEEVFWSVVTFLPSAAVLWENVHELAPEVGDQEVS